MIAGALICGLLAMFAYGLANTLSLPLAKRFNPARMLLLRGVGICVVILLLSIPSLGNLRDWHAALAAFAIGVFGYLPPLAFTHGIKVSRISIVAPIAGTAPLITTLLSVAFLSVHLRGMQWLGVALVVAANIAASIDFRNFRNSNIAKLASGVPFGLAAAVGWGVVFFLIIYPTRALGPWVSAFMLELGVVAAAAVHVALRREPFLLKQAANRQVLVNGGLIALGTLAFTVGVHSFSIGPVTALSNSFAVVAIVTATILHHERLTRSEKILAALMAAGVVVISL